MNSIATTAAKAVQFVSCKTKNASEKTLTAGVDIDGTHFSEDVPVHIVAGQSLRIDDAKFVITEAHIANINRWRHVEF